VSAALSSSPKAEEAPVPGANLLLVVAAAAVLPFDRVLAGMVAAGQGIDALCLFLSLSREALDDTLVRLGLRTPHDRPLRKPGPRGWPVTDVIRLIYWRATGVHPEDIGRCLSRSANAVRSKCRRLGIPTPDRKALRRVDPASLRDPPALGLAGVCWPGVPVPASSRAPSRPYRPGPAAPAAAASAIKPSGAPTLAPAPVPPAAGTTASGVVALRPQAAPAPVGDQVAPTPGSQRTLQLFRVVPAHPITVPPAAPAAPVAPIKPPVPATAPLSPQTAPPRVSSSSDLTWVSRLKRIDRNEAAVLALSLRYFGGQDYKSIARDAGMTVRAVTSIFTRVNLPRDLFRKKFGPEWDAGCAQATLDRSGYILQRDISYADREEARRPLFWRQRRDGIRTSRATRFRNGQLDDYDRYQGQRITLVTRADLDAPGFSLPEPPSKVPSMRASFVPPFAERSPTMHP